MKFQSGLEFAKHLDATDKLSEFRTQFHIPTDQSGKSLIYFCGNSLGLQPKVTKSCIETELDKWAQLGVEGHTQGRFPWLHYHEFLTEAMAEIVGAKNHEVVVMNSLTVNLHLMMASFFQPTKSRFKIFIESDVFSSDK